MTKNNLTLRQYHLDYLRVFASVAIILLHVTAQNIRYVELAGTEWNIYNICNSASRWAVPVFVMISGALFLPREIPCWEKIVATVEKICRFVPQLEFFGLEIIITDDGFRITRIMNHPGYPQRIPLILSHLQKRKQYQCP